MMNRFLLSLSPVPEYFPQSPKLLLPHSAVRLNLPTTADTDYYIPIRNLSTTHKHYTTHTDLCSTTRDTCRTCCSRQTTTDPRYCFPGKAPPEPLTVLARPLYIPFDHTTTVGLPYSLTRHITICPPTTTEPGSRVRVAGHDRAESGAVSPSVRGGHAVSPPRAQLPQNLRGIQFLVIEAVGA
jgi:hypothetical protein